jgi:hypothetical protein
MAQQLIEIIKTLPSATLKKACYLYYLHQLLENKIAKHLTNKIHIVDYQNGIISLSINGGAWAQEMQFHKALILQIYKEQGVKVSDIKIFVGDEENKRPENKVIKCQTCGRTIEGVKKVCPICANEQWQKLGKRIRQQLRQTPWIRYEEIKEIIAEDIDENIFISTKDQLKNEIFDKIKKNSYELNKTNEIQLREKLQKEAALYTMLLYMLPIDKINEKAITKCLWETLSRVIYKDQG